MTNEITPDEISDWYRGKILRIPHGKQDQYACMNKEQVLELFSGRVVIQEKVDGNMGWSVDNGKRNRIIRIHENVPVKRYGILPANKRVHLDSIFVPDEGVPYIGCHKNVLDYADMRLVDPTIEEIYGLLEAFAQMPSHFGASEIEGLVVKNYTDGRNVLFGKWVNDSFEELL